MPPGRLMPSEERLTPPEWPEGRSGPPQGSFSIVGKRQRKVEGLAKATGQALYAESGLIVPARRSIREDHVFLRQQPYATQVFVEETELGRPNLNIPQAGDINRLLSQALQPVWRERTAAEAIREVAPALRQLIGGS